MGQGGLAMQPRLSCCVPWHAQFSHCHLSRTTVLLAAELSSFLHSTAVHGLQDSLGVLPVPPPPMTAELEPMAGSSSALLTLPQLCSQAKPLLLCSPL